MKNFTVLITIYLFTFYPTYFAQPYLNFNMQNSCPPYHTETKSILENFIVSEAFSEERQDIGLDGVTIDDINYLDDNLNKAVCEQIGKKYPWPVTNHFRVYYGSKEHFYVVNAQKPMPPAKTGQINIQTGYSLIIILNKDFDYVSSYLL